MKGNNFYLVVNGFGNRYDVYYMMWLIVVIENFINIRSDYRW